MCPSCLRVAFYHTLVSLRVVMLEFKQCISIFCLPLLFKRQVFLLAASHYSVYMWLTIDVVTASHSAICASLFKITHHSGIVNFFYFVCNQSFPKIIWRRLTFCKKDYTRSLSVQPMNRFKSRNFKAKFEQTCKTIIFEVTARMHWNRGRLVNCDNSIILVDHCRQIAQNWCLLSHRFMHYFVAIFEFITSLHYFPFNSDPSSPNSLNIVLLTKSFEFSAEHVNYCLAHPSSFNKRNELMFIRSHKS